MSYRLLSLSAGIALLAITIWAVVSGSGSVRSGEDVLAFGLLCLAIAGLGGFIFLVLRWATSGSAIYWRTGDAPREVARIFAMIICALVVHMAVGAYFDRQGRLGETAAAVSLVIWTLFPAIFLGARIVRWPSRVLRPSAFRLLIVGAIALGIAAALTSLGFFSAASESQIQPVSKWPLVLGSVVLGAAAEEVVWRVLLLTALLQATLSRFQAVFLSGVGFAMMHAPLVLMQPVLRADWPMLHFAVNAYAPEFLMTTAVGCFLGVVWLRTGSITLVVLTHVVLNLGHALVFGV
ncbi:CPBP family glutamic-type intramembrane protease [Brevundimonas sp.]|uniref:CPBP family glutamic-type intramembrane protease n=1 Tax=Brevundimonas sp. TaxID=1871086 RepID=UPI003F7042C7